MRDIRRRIGRLETRGDGRTGQGLAVLLSALDHCADVPYGLADVAWLRRQGGLAAVLADAIEEGRVCDSRPA